MAAPKLPQDYIEPLSMNGLEGRMIHVPAPKGKKREILIVHGHHSSLERWWGFIEDLNQYGSVTMPDLPGFGGMESFYKIGQQPTIDNLADYLAAFVKMRYKRKRVTIIGSSLGFVVLTRMLQRYPDLAGKVDMLISVVGFAHRDDFVFSKKRMHAYRLGSKFFSRRLPALFFRNVFLHPLILRAAYGHTRGGAEKFNGMSNADHKKTMKFEIHLWHVNDVRTHMATLAAFLDIDNCQVKVNLPVWHISVDNDRYFDHHNVQQHMSIIFSKFHQATVIHGSHAPSIIADKEQASAMIPADVRRLLSKNIK